MKPSVGRIVHFIGYVSNGINDHPAIITRVWSDICVNLTVFLDAAPPITMTSVNKAGSFEGQTTSWDWPVKV